MTLVVMRPHLTSLRQWATTLPVATGTYLWWGHLKIMHTFLPFPSSSSYLSLKQVCVCAGETGWNVYLSFSQVLSCPSPLLFIWCFGACGQIWPMESRSLGWGLKSFAIMGLQWLALARRDEMTSHPLRENGDREWEGGEKNKTIWELRRITCVWEENRKSAKAINLVLCIVTVTTVPVWIRLALTHVDLTRPICKGEAHSSHPFLVLFGSTENPRKCSHGWPKWNYLLFSRVFPEVNARHDLQLSRWEMTTVCNKEFVLIDKAGHHPSQMNRSERLINCSGKKQNVGFFLYLSSR
jgi:hypothetical protein